MLTKEQIKEVREHLESSQNPVFFFDNDLDGLCSYLLCRRFLGRGKGVAIKSFPELDETYTRKIREFNPDKIFVLDKPLVSEGFLNYCKERNIPVVWIDHHSVPKPKGVDYYNPLLNKKPSAEPVSYLIWQVVQRDDWVSLLGCIYDWYLPDFVKDFSNKYPGLINKTNDPGVIRFKSEFGKLVLKLTFAMKDSTTNVMKMIRLLIDAQTPYEILSGEKKYEYMLRRASNINRKYEKLLGKALRQEHGKIIFFQYGGDMSITGELCNALVFNYPKKMVVVAFAKGEKVNISLRGGKKDIREILSKVFEKIEGTGGGHPQACGASIKLKDLGKFKELIEGFS